MPLDGPARNTSSDAIDPGRLKVTVQQESTVIQVYATGELDVATVASLRAALAGHPRQRRDLLLDLTGVTFMDSTGLHLLVEMKRHTARDGASMRLVVSQPVQKVLELTGLLEHFDC